MAQGEVFERQRALAAKKADAITIKQGPLAAPSRPRSCRDVALSLNSVHCDDSAAPPDAVDATGVNLGPGILTRPTASAISLTLFAHTNIEAYVEYGRSSGLREEATLASVYPAGKPFTFDLVGFAASQQYFYRVRWRAPGASQYEAGEEHSFWTARNVGQSFTFTVQADPHLDGKSDLELYGATLHNELADGADFMLDLGDTFMCEKHSAPLTTVQQTAPDYPTVAARYQYELGNFGLVAHSAPLFLVNGNHDGEAGWALDGTADNVAVWATLARNAYFAPPAPDGFYSGSVTLEPFVGQRNAYYAWTWGDALFVVLDPFWYTAKKPSLDLWGWTLGREQYDWLARTLNSADAKYRFVFIHNLVGGMDSQARGGIEVAPFYEWGGHDPDGTLVFDAMRPGWGKPIHQLLVENRVNAVFHGHDHVYVKQELDGVVYQETPQPSAPNFNNGPTLAAEGHYASGVIVSSSGHLRVTVGPDSAVVSYVRAYRPQDENAQRHNGDEADTYTLLPR
jgi:hypothetical protein